MGPNKHQFLLTAWQQSGLMGTGGCDFRPLGDILTAQQNRRSV